MCGRIASNITGVEQILELYGLRLLQLDFTPRYNVAPGQDVLAVIQPPAQERQAVYLRWGLLPPWAKDPAIAYKLINARAETAAEKPAFRDAWRRRRCIIPVSGFYEWQRSPERKAKIPYYIRLRAGHIMSLAGLWEVRREQDDSLTCTCTILTTEANSLVAPIHNRMPVLLPPGAFDLWLNHDSYDPQLIKSLMQPYPAEEMEAYRVSTIVNSAANDVPECLLPWNG